MRKNYLKQGAPRGAGKSIFAVSSGISTFTTNAITANTAGGEGGGILQLNRMLTLDATISGNTPDDCNGVGC